MPEEDRYIRLLYFRDRFRSASRTAREMPGRHNPRIPADTIQRRLRQHDQRCLRQFHGNVLTPVRRRRRQA